MKVLVIGASGTIGSGVVAELKARGHEVIGASRNGEVKIDLTDNDSIAAALAQVGKVDAVVSCAGHVPFKPLAELSYDDYLAGAKDKLLGQVELTRQSIAYLTDGGSITLTSGILAREAIATGAVASMVNGGLESFVMAAACEMPRGIRINVVSGNVLVEAPGFHPFFPGFIPIPLSAMVAGYVKSVDGIHTGRTYQID